MSDKDSTATYRILDASANRASEGLRTMEEFSRFVLDDAATCGEFKSLRHGLAAAISRLPRESLLAARDTVADVGTQLQQPAEYERSNMAEIVAAAAARTQQSLRVLEEYSKLIDAKISADLEQLRYRCYTVSASLELQLRRNDLRDRLQAAQLYALVDAGSSAAAFGEFVRSIVQAGVDIVQLRDRSIDDRTLLARARQGTEITRQLGGLFIMNDRPDLAVGADTDGVHVGQDELPVAETRRIVGANRLIGVSTHSIEQAREAVADGADYIGCGPVFPGRTKAFESYVGTVFLKAVADEIKLPAFAIGGIEGSNMEQVLQTGVRRVAVTGAIRDANDPVAAARELKKRLG